MSVYKTQRNKSEYEYVSLIRVLRLTSYRIIRKFPKSYRWLITNNMLDLVNDVHINIAKADAIKARGELTEKDQELRHRYFMIAYSDIVALGTEITFCYELISKGNNFYKDKNEYNRDFQTWISDLMKAAEELAKTMDIEQVGLQPDQN